jgi:hypothetical protein
VALELGLFGLQVVMFRVREGTRVVDGAEKRLCGEKSLHGGGRARGNAEVDLGVDAVDGVAVLLEGGLFIDAVFLSALEGLI